MSWFTKLQEDAEGALAAAVSKVDKVLDIKEETGLGGSKDRSAGSDDKSTAQLLAEAEASSAIRDDDSKASPSSGSRKKFSKAERGPGATSPGPSDDADFFAAVDTVPDGGKKSPSAAADKTADSSGSKPKQKRLTPAKKAALARKEKNTRKLSTGAVKPGSATAGGTAASTDHAETATTASAADPVTCGPDGSGDESAASSKPVADGVAGPDSDAVATAASEEPSATDPVAENPPEALTMATGGGDTMPEDASVEEYAKKLAEVTSLLAAREQQILSSQRGFDDEREGFTEQLAELEAARDELSNELAESGSKLDSVIDDRDSTKKKLAELTERFKKEVTGTTALNSELIAEKDKKIEALMREGKKLSDQSFKSSNINKKLQAKAKEADAAAVKMNARIKDAEAEIEKLQSKLAEKVKAEKEYQQSASKVSAMTDQQFKEMAALKTAAKQHEDKAAALQAALDKAYKLNSALEQDVATAQAEARNAVSAAEAGAQESLEQEVKRLKNDASRVQEGLGAQVADLQTALQRGEAQAARRESNLQKEIADLNDRLRLAEEREQQLTESMSQTTKPLIRQIDMLRESLANQNINHELAETTLSARFEEAQRALQDAEEQERTATERLSEMRIKSSGLEEKVNKLRRELGEVKSHLESATLKNDELEISARQDREKVTDLERAHAAAEANWSERLESAKRASLDRVSVLQGQLKEAEERRISEAEALRKSSERNLANGPNTEPDGGGDPAGGRQSPAGLIGAGASALTASGQGRRSAGAGPEVGGAADFERLQSGMRQKAEDIVSLQAQLAAVEKNRAHIADELVELVRKNDELSTEANKVAPLTARLTATEQKLDQVLQMYGEKAEEANELRLDLQDVKGMFRSQTQQMMGRIEELQQALPAR